ncbi:mfeA [Symbiodinium sp. CCMP2456]|nr:mfeA [Symbiodinium sp. CCMP2456]
MLLCWGKQDWVAATAALSRERRGDAGYTFGLSSSEDHKGLLTAQKDNAYRVSTEGSFLSGHYNTVLGDQEIPSSGRSYWEVKIVTKPSDAWEFIGVAEPTADVTMPLHKNKKGKGWFWGGDWSESFIYTFMEMKPGMNDKKMVCKEGMSSPLPPISPRPIYSASSAASAASGSTRRAADRLPALDSMSQMSARIQALSKQQVELKREIKEARSLETPPPSERVSEKLCPASRGSRGSRGSRSLPIEPRGGERRSWGKGIGKDSSKGSSKGSSQKGQHWKPTGRVSGEPGGLGGRADRVARAARPPPATAVRTYDDRGIPNFRSRHEDMKAEWAGKWGDGDEDWGEWGEWDEWDEDGDWGWDEGWDDGWEGGYGW